MRLVIPPLRWPTDQLRCFKWNPVEGSDHICPCSEGCVEQLHQLVLYSSPMCLLYSGENHILAGLVHTSVPLSLLTAGRWTTQRIDIVWRICAFNLKIKTDPRSRNKKSLFFFFSWMKRYYFVLYSYPAALSESRWLRADGERFSCTVLLSSNQIRKSIKAH